MPTTATPNILSDPGYLFYAPAGTAEPVNTVAGSKFTDTWPVAWVSVGATEDGSKFKASVKTEAVNVAEFFDPIKYVTTDRSSSIAFAMADFTLTKLKWSMNGGTPCRRTPRPTRSPASSPRTAPTSPWSGSRR